MTLSLARVRTLAIPRDIAFPAALAITFHVGLSLFAAYIALSSPDRVMPRDPFYLHGITPIEPQGWNLLYAPLQRWDGIWYQLVAERGIVANDASAAFFPLLPILARMLAVVIPNIALTLQITSGIAAVLTLVVFYRVTKRSLGQQVADRAAIAWVVFPTAFYLFAPYPESLFLVCALLSLEAALDDRWLRAGLFGAFAVLARSPGVLLIIPLGAQLLLAYGQAAGARREGGTRAGLDLRWLLPRAASLALVLLSFGAYMLYLQLAFGDAMLWSHAFSSWKGGWTLPWEPVVRTAALLLSGQMTAIGNNVVDLSSTLFVLGFTLVGLLPRENWAARPDTSVPQPAIGDRPGFVKTLIERLRNFEPRLPLVYTIYGLVYIGIPIMMADFQSHSSYMPLIAAGRRAIVVFPAFMLAGRVLNGKWRFLLYFALALLLQLALLAMFVQWRWVD